MSEPRINRYLNAVSLDTRKAMTLYRKNLKLSQEMFTIVSCFEVALRNAIDRHYTNLFGPEWLKDFVLAGGQLDTVQSRTTKNIISNTKQKLGVSYTHPKLVAELDFGLWRYLFAKPQFLAGGQNLLQIFPSKPTSTPTIQYNHTFIFNELAKINDLRNRIAHHEPICFVPNNAVINTNYTRQSYNLIVQFFRWMNINESELLYGLDHIINVCNEIDNI
ncbi:Abi family protein [Chryseobacterium wangxinyae]|nr:Abi family protein [Chryseobacterium sp. CY350]WBZ95797.1 Abi family protein [Chryseobacterium sp. CY350]